MTPAQNAVFQAGSGSTPEKLFTTIASGVMVLVLVFIWAMWVTFGTLRAWQ
jgi:integrating conjugative element protein (TIGR03758 family)